MTTVIAQIPDCIETDDGCVMLEGYRGSFMKYYSSYTTFKDKKTNRPNTIDECSVIIMYIYP